MKTRQGISLDEMRKHGKVLISTAGRQNCAENGPEWVTLESGEIYSEDLSKKIVKNSRNEETHLEKWELGK